MAVKAGTKKAVKKKTKRKVPKVADAKRAITEAGCAKIGRPARAFEPETAESIVKRVTDDGLPWVVAGDLHGVNQQVVALWVMENEGFALALKKAQAEHVRCTLARLRELPAGQWQKAGWELERIYPNQFGQNARLEVTGTAKLEINGAVCAQMLDSWKRFRTKVIDVEPEVIEDK